MQQEKGINNLNLILPKSKYRCQKCLYEFEEVNPGPVSCPHCRHKYIDWLNAAEVLAVCKVIDNRK